MPVLPRTDQQYLEKLRAMSRSALSAVLRGATEVALVGVPNHRNLGDTMIAAGTLAHLRHLGVKVVQVLDPNFASHLHLHQLKILPRQIPILLHGGGNVGDLYPHEERFRQEIFRALPNRRYIIMPQTVHFESAGEARLSAQAYAGVGNLAVMTRDRPSEGLARELYPTAEVIWSPDHALGWTPRLSGRHTRVSLTVVARSDSESRRVDNLNLPDWKFARANVARWNAVTRMALRYRHAPGSQYVKWASTSFSVEQLRTNLAAAERLVSKSSVIVSNRLHAHVLAALGGRPHFIADNNYGKVSRIFDEYTGEFTTANWSSSLGAALLEAQELLSGA